MTYIVYGIIATCLGIAFLGFGIYLLSKYQRTAYISWFSSFIFLLAGWSITNGVVLFVPFRAHVDILGRLIFVFIGLACPFFYLFVKSFPFSERRMQLDEYVLLFFPGLLVVSMLFFSNLLVVGFENVAYEYTVYGPLFWVYIAYILGTGLASVILLIDKLRTPEIHQKQYILQILIVSSLSLLIGSVGSLIIPFFFHTKENTWSILGVSTVWVVMLSRIVLTSSKGTGNNQ